MLKKNKTMKGKINALWKIFEKNLAPEIKEFYWYYKGQITELDELGGALKFLMITLHDFYESINKETCKVIVLVDEHDAPVQLIHESYSFENSSKNVNLMKSINNVAGIISDILGEMAKTNQYLRKFLMFGISDAILSRRHSGFNNRKIIGVSDTNYSRFFACNKDEIGTIVTKAFKDVGEKVKEKIMQNIEDWYNGYYHNKDEKLCSIFSTIQYLGD
jgi:hypothetical protein